MKFFNLFTVLAILGHNTAANPSEELRATANYPDSGCPNISPGPATAFQLADLLPLLSPTDPGSAEAIRNTLAVYAFAVDGRNWNALTRVFTADARANYSAPLGVSYGVANITTSISSGINTFPGTQHRYGSQYVNVCSTDTAISITYFEASHYFVPDLGPSVADDNQVLYANGRYEDTWFRQDDGSWKIANRNLVYMGPLILDSS